MDTHTRYETQERVERDAREHANDTDRQGSSRQMDKALAVNTVECGSGWYHEAAIEDAKARSRAA